MKNSITSSVKSFAVVLLTIAGLFSCKQLLDVSPTNLLLEEEAFKDQAGFEKVLNGAYANLMGIYDGANGGELLGGDFNLFATLLLRQSGSEIFWDGSKAPDYTNILKKQILPGNSRVEANWQRAYKTINMVNAIIEEIEKKEIADKDRIKGEALAIRGILYFELVRLWGPQYSSSTLNASAVPLIIKSIRTKDDIKAPKKATVSAIYSQVENDFKEASKLLKGKGKNVNKISFFGCQAYLARMYMQQNDFKKALPILNEVIGGGFTLTANPADAFNNANNSTEDILAIKQTTKANTGSAVSTTGLPTLHSSLTNGVFAFRIIKSSMESSLANRAKFSSSDKRFSINEKTTKTTKADEIKTAFYLDPNQKFQVSCAKYVSNTQVIPVIRLAEMYLDRAEALHRQNFSSPINPQALSDLNKIRTRAGLKAIDNSISASAFYDSLILERNRELLFEGLLLHDNKRWAVSGKVIKVAFRYSPLDKKLILPIPQSECNVNPELCK